MTKTFVNPTLPGTPIKNQHPKSNIHAIIKLIVTDANGYVAGVRCGLNHSGNDRLAGPTNGHYQCCGCGSFSTAGDVLNTQRGQIGGEKGNGGIYRARA